MDILMQAALAYKELLNKEYVISVGKNCKTRSYVIQFSADQFKHICGLHKLKDIKSICRSSSEALFHQIIRGEIDIQDFKSQTRAEIEERIKNVVYLEKYFDNFSQIYDWDCKRSKFSHIDADIMIPIKSSVAPDKDTYIFLKKDVTDKTLKLSDYIVEQPAFESLVTAITDKRDYREGQVRPPTLLYKEKIDLINNSKEILYSSPSFSVPNETLNQAESVLKDLQSPTNDLKNGITNFSLLSERSENNLSFAPLRYSAGALAAVLPDPNRYNPLGELLKNVIAGLSDVSKKITEFLTAPLPSVHIDERTQPSQARKPSARKINYNIPFAKQTPSDERSEPSAAKPERRSSWIDKMLSSAKREADENNSKHEIKSHDKDKSL